MPHLNVTLLPQWGSSLDGVDNIEIESVSQLLLPDHPTRNFRRLSDIYCDVFLISHLI